MTFCVGIRVAEGIVALADTRIVRGSEQVNKQKLAEFRHEGQVLFTMTSGLRSIRDKTLTYVDETLRRGGPRRTHLYQFVNLFGQELRRVRQEDAASLAAAGFTFNLHAIIGGRFPHDPGPHLFYVYPQGNWVEVSPDSPYFIIGRTCYGKPILDRLLTHDTPMIRAVALGLLAFDATRTSVTDVDYPIDVAVLPVDAATPRFHRFAAADLAQTVDHWSASLADSLRALPMDWAGPLLDGWSRIESTDADSPDNQAPDNQAPDTELSDTSTWTAFAGDSPETSAS